MNFLKPAFVFCFLLFNTIHSFGEITLPKLISDGMILQRNTSIKIWGWADANEVVQIQFSGNTYHTTTNDIGTWSTELNPMNAGGPYQMTIEGSNKIIINDIMIGDVWICSGQSNMELSVKRVSWVYDKIIGNAENDHIRQFYVPRDYNFKAPQKDLNAGNWVKSTPENVLDFSAVAYFFARDLYEMYKIPIGLINTSMGGSPAEAWMSEDALKAFPAHYHEAMRYNDDALIEKIKEADRARINSWHEVSGQTDLGHQNVAWYEPTLNTTDWNSLDIPGYWTSEDLKNTSGVIWFRKNIELPASMTGKPGKIILGRIVDADSVFVNGTFVGSTGYQYPPRRYDIPSGLLKSGNNSITIRVISNSGNGGFVPDKAYELTDGNEVIDLKGQWQYKIGTIMDPLAPQTFIRWKPMGLYNAMIAPLTNYTIKGTIWYQGESNADEPMEYRELFPAMINDWRNQWQQGNFPFLFVQLANYMAASDTPKESNWALLRESQTKALALPNTAMATAIDLGEWNDIHPLNKKDVGERLARAAKKIAYNENHIVDSGPVFKSMEIDDNKVILTFGNIGSGLVAKGNDSLQHFAIVGDDHNFEWANAKIKGNEVIVWSRSIPNPVAVRYAWADNPESANLYNKEGLPAVPFRTDNWNP